MGLLTPALLGSVLIASPAHAASTCPKTLKAVSGGAGDATSNGFDDGDKGEGADYVGGQIILQVDPDITRGELQCIADELGATIQKGGTSKQGLHGVPDTALLQLPPNKSVTKTIALLARSAYRDFIEYAEPNDYQQMQVIQPPNDPMFGYQWGLMNPGFAPFAASPFLGTENRKPLAPTQTASMRFPQAWDYMRRGRGVTAANPRGNYDRINVGIVDDSYFAHPELVRNSDLTAGGMVFSYGGNMKLNSAAQPTERYAINLGTLPDLDVPSRPLRTCQLTGRASEDEISTALRKGVDEMCGYDEVGIYDLVLAGAKDPSIDNGEFTLMYGRKEVGRYPVNIASGVIQRDLKTLFGANVDLSVTMISGKRFSGNLIRAVHRIILPQDAETAVMTANVGTLKSPDPSFPVSASIVEPPDVTVAENRNISNADKAALPGINKQFLINLRVPQYLRDTLKPPFSITPLQSVTITQGSTRITNDEAGWPGRMAPKESSALGGTHGENIAGMIGAEANNAAGMTGALGPYHNVKMYGLVSPTYSSEEIAGAIGQILDRNDPQHPRHVTTHVVNLSLGSANRTNTIFDNAKGEDAQKAGYLSRLISSAPQNSPTLFVVAAGNTGGNLNDQVTRNNQTYGGGNKVSGDACRPKGHGVTMPPENGGEHKYYETPADQRAKRNQQRVTKGGTLNYLKMPDGTFDRGNMLCVGAVDWRGQPSTFTDWGRGTVDVGAAGTNILGTSANNGYAIDSGTSFAAPLVTAAAALVYSAIPPQARKPWLVKCAILSSATTLSLPIRGDLELRALSSAKYERKADLMNPTLEMDPRAGYSRGNRPDQFGPNGEMFTVNGIVNAQLAIKAGQSIARKVARNQRPTCVQKKSIFGWKNTRTDG